HPNVEQHVISKLEWLNDTVVWDDPLGPTLSGTLTAKVKATTAIRQGGPPYVPASSRLVVFRVLRNGVVDGNWIPKSTRTFKTDVIQYWGPAGVQIHDDEGPFALGIPTDASGESTIRLDVLGVLPGDQISF